MQLTPTLLNEQVRQATSYDASRPPGKEIPWWRNIYILSIKQSRTQAPILKKICRQGGFQAARAFCEDYCEKMGYQYIALCPEFSDLEFEMYGDDSYKAGAPSNQQTGD